MQSSGPKKLDFFDDSVAITALYGVSSGVSGSLELSKTPSMMPHTGDKASPKVTIYGNLPFNYIREEDEEAASLTGRTVQQKKKPFVTETFQRALDAFEVLGSDDDDPLTDVELYDFDSDSEDNIEPDFPDRDEFSTSSSNPSLFEPNSPIDSPNIPTDISGLPDLLLPLVGTVTDAMQTLWTHRLFRHRLDQWFPADSALALARHFSNTKELPSVLIPAGCHLARNPLVTILTWMIEGRYQEFCEVVGSAGLEPLVRDEILTIGELYWKGGHEADLIHRFHKALMPVTAEQTRILTRAGGVLFQRSREISIERTGENLELIRDSLNIAFRLIKRDMDERARYEVDDRSSLRDSENRSRLHPIDLEETKYPKGSLGYKLERLIQRISKRLRTYFNPEYFGVMLDEAASRCSHDADIACFIERLVENREIFVRVAADMSALAIEPTQRFLTHTLENFLLNVLAHDASELLTDVVGTLHSTLRVYIENKDKVERHNPKNPLPLLQRLDETEERWCLHQCIPLSMDPGRIQRADQDYIVHHLIPSFKELIFPNSTLMDEVIQAFIENEATWTDAVGVKERPAQIARAAFSGIDHALSVLVSEPIIEMINQYLSPDSLNQMVIKLIEEQWMVEIAKCEANGDRTRQKQLVKFEHDYDRLVRSIGGSQSERYFEQSKVAIHYAVILWAPNPYPGTHAVVEGTALQFHEILQCTPVVKHLVYHLIDRTLKHLTKRPRKVAADLSKPIHKIVRKHGSSGPFTDECMRQMAKLVLYSIRMGANHLPKDTSYSGWGSILAAKILAWFSESWVIETIKSILEDLWVNKFELSFPGLLALCLDKLHAWIQDSKDGLEAILKDRASGLPIKF